MHQNNIRFWIDKIRDNAWDNKFTVKIGVEYLTESDGVIKAKYCAYDVQAKIRRGPQIIDYNEETSLL